jgi:predicted small lipoprotein YifL
MKNVVLALMFVLTVAACQSKGGKTTPIAAVNSDPDVVNVIYFHGKQR